MTHSEKHRQRNDRARGRAKNRRIKIEAARWNVFCHFLDVTSRQNLRYNIDIEFDRRDWVRTRRTYYKMRELFLDPRKNIARSPHALMLLPDAAVRARDAGEFLYFEKSFLRFREAVAREMPPPCGRALP